jgi:hypothetical protein
MNIYLNAIKQTMSDAYIHNRKLMEYMVNADRTLKKEKCPNHTTDSSITIDIPINEPPQMIDNICCQEFRTRFFSICDISKEVEHAKAKFLK